MKPAAATLGLMTLSVLCHLQWSVVSGSTDRDRLFGDLTRNYQKNVEPDNAVLKVLLLLSCARHDKANGILTTNALEKLNWSDQRLAWDPKDYGGIQTIRFPWNLIWVPDVKLYNSMTAVDERDKVNVAVTSNGTILWAPTVVYRTPCSGNSTGTGLKCQINLGSWTYDSDTVKLELNRGGVSLDNYRNSTCPLTVDSAMAVIRPNYKAWFEPFNHVEINLQLRPQTV